MVQISLLIQRLVFDAKALVFVVPDSPPELDIGNG
jgi:hypothetical protein